MILFYTSDIDNNEALLEEDEFQHCCKVLRHREGDVIHITNGQGIFAQARIEHIHKRHASLNIIHQTSRERKSIFIELAVAPPKTKSRWEWLLEKTVEVGVDKISPIITSNIERKKINLDRNRKIIRSAALQSKRITHPEMSEIISLEKYLAFPEVQTADKFLCHFDDTNLFLNKAEYSSNHLIVFVGPEGDFNDQELSLLKQYKCQEVNISKNRLRTETAAIVAISQVSALIE
ncbi:MAG: 16S rRNA (uracil(1498)-N(3))-methyltransferase [Saprospiraceae bacterium]|nr:16S rRNA (uracil(1498)-N(3))-methyltransferase [Saprospiraceae bacterium]